jgi:uncharacterized protein (DUF1015 family)
MERSENVGIIFPEILIPEAKTNLKKWAVVACDQFTTNQDYWIKTGRVVGGAPSTLHIIVPELYIKSDDLEDRIAHAKDTMASYIEDGVLVRLPKGVILVERETKYRTRVGIVLGIDLERYDPDSTKKPLIRATEQTVAERVPVRVKLREGAVLECPHTMVLIDDVKNSVIGPVYEERKNYAKVYDTPLMQDGGNLRGWFIDDEEVLDRIVASLEKLKTKTKGGMLFAVGDGNHSLACAKAVWEKHKEDMTKEQRETSPLRYALVELVNLYDNGISMEPIHRVLFNVEPSGALRILVSILNEMGAEARMMYTRGAKAAPKDGTQTIFFESKMSKGRIEIAKPQHGLLGISLTLALDKLLKELPKAEIDYVHDEEEFHDLTNEHATLGFLMEPIEKDGLFNLITEYGVLPRKSFSLGMPEEKRYYCECRLLVEAKSQQSAEDEARGQQAETLEQEPPKEEEPVQKQEESLPAQPEENLPEEPEQFQQSEERENTLPEEDEDEDFTPGKGNRGKDRPKKQKRGLFGRKSDRHESLPETEENQAEEPEQYQPSEEPETPLPEEKEDEDFDMEDYGRKKDRPKKQRKGLFGRKSDWHESL